MPVLRCKGRGYRNGIQYFPEQILTGIPERYEVADSEFTQINAVEVEIDINTGYAVAIKRIFCSRNNKEKEESQ